MLYHQAQRKPCFCCQARWQGICLVRPCVYAVEVVECRGCDGVIGSIAVFHVFPPFAAVDRPVRHKKQGIYFYRPPLCTTFAV